MNRLTYDRKDGTWDLKQGDIRNVPGWLYGCICRLHEYEKLGISPQQIKEIDTLYAAKCREVAELEQRSAAAG